MSAPGESPTLPTLGQQLREVLPSRRLHSVSLCDHEANVLWLSEGALGPDEHSLVVEALEVLAGDPSMPCHETTLEDGRCALILPVRAPTGQLVGVAMILGECKSLGEDTQERLVAAPVRAIMQRLAVLLKPAGAQRSAHRGVDMRFVELDLDAALQAASAKPRAAAAPAAPAPKPAAARAGAATPQVISPQQVDDLLEFEVSSESVSVATRRTNGSTVHSTLDTPSDMVRLEFLPSQEAAPSPQPPAPSAPPTAAASPARPAAPAAAAAPPARVAVPPTAAAPPARHAAPPTAAAPPARHAAPAGQATPSAPPREGVPPASEASATPQGDANLTLEVLPYAKVRPGGQNRRFQILARFSPRVAQCDTATLDALILQRLVAWLAAHRTVWNCQPTTFTVSVSIGTLEDAHFAQKVAAQLNAHGIAAETLGFEIAEALCTQHRAQAERFIAQCEKLGASVVIDDFSFDVQVLPLLRSKAVRLVKIDPKLTSSALKDKLAQALVIATVQAAKVLGIHCAAKRVDTQASAQWLGAIGCDFGQGAAFSAAKPLEALAASPDATGVTTLNRPPNNTGNQ